MKCLTYCNFHRLKWFAYIFCFALNRVCRIRYNKKKTQFGRNNQTPPTQQKYFRLLQRREYQLEQIHRQYWMEHQITFPTKYERMQVSFVPIKEPYNCTNFINLFIFTHIYQLNDELPYTLIHVIIYYCQFNFIVFFYKTQILYFASLTKMDPTRLHANVLKHVSCYFMHSFFKI